MNMTLPHDIYFRMTVTEKDQDDEFDYYVCPAGDNIMFFIQKLENIMSYRHWVYPYIEFEYKIEEISKNEYDEEVAA